METYTQNGTQPLVSVIVPTKNRPYNLDEALQSISGQTYKNIEVIIINDGGEDVEHVFSRFRDKLRIICKKLQEGKGPSAARNCGLREARGKYVHVQSPGNACLDVCKTIRECEGQLLDSG